MPPLDSRYRPVVALDLDGVIRLAVSGDSDCPTTGAYAANVTVHRDAYPSAYHSQLVWNHDGVASGTVWLSGVGSAWIRALLERGIDVRWATTWQAHANRYFAPLLRIPDLPVAVTGEESRAYSSAEWKSQQLGRQFDGRPLVWIDDVPVSMTHMQLELQRRPRDRGITRFYRVGDPQSGISVDDVAELDAWLELASSEAGQAELQRLRRNDRERYRARRDRERFGSRERASYWRKVHKAAGNVIGDASLMGPRLAADYALANTSIERDQLLEEVGRWVGPDEIDWTALVQAIASVPHPSARSSQDNDQGPVASK